MKRLAVLAKSELADALALVVVSNCPQKLNIKAPLLTLRGLKFVTTDIDLIERIASGSL